MPFRDCALNKNQRKVEIDPTRQNLVERGRYLLLFQASQTRSESHSTYGKTLAIVCIEIWTNSKHDWITLSCGIKQWREGDGFGKVSQTERDFVALQACRRHCAADQLRDCCRQKNFGWGLQLHVIGYWLRNLSFYRKLSHYDRRCVYRPWSSWRGNWNHDWSNERYDNHW